MRSVGLKKQVHPAITAIVVIGVLVAVDYAWYKGLIWKPPPITPRPGGPTGSAPPPVTTILGRTDVTVDTFSGDLEPGDADGPGHAARFDRPTGLAVDAQGNVYVADTGNHRIRKIAPDGQTTTLAGSVQGFKDGPAAQAQFNAPCGLAVSPDGAIYVADSGNNAIRLIVGGRVSTVKCASPPGSTARNDYGPNRPISIAYFAGAKPMISVAEAGSRMLSQFHLDGTHIISVPVEQVVTCVVAPVNGSSMESSTMPETGEIRVSSKNGATSLLPLKNVHIQDSQEPALAVRHPVAMWPMGDTWLVTDSVHPAVLRLSGGSVEVLAGTCSSAEPMRGSRDGDGSKAQFGILSGIVADNKGHVYVADTGNNEIRRITL